MSDTVRRRRGKWYKKGVDLVEARRRREDSLLQLRKTSKSHLRKTLFSSSSSSSSSSCLEDSAENSVYPVCLRHGVEFSPEDELAKISEMAHWLWSEDQAQQIKASSYFGNITSIEERTPIDLVIKAGVIPRLVHFISRNDLPAQQFEAVCTLVNIASGTSEQTQVVIDHGAVPNLVHLLRSPNQELKEQAVRALGNIAGDSSHCRDIVLANGVLIPLLSLLNPRSRLSMLRTASWALSNFFCSRPAPDINQIKPALSVIQKLLYSTDAIILENACWGVAYIFGGEETQLQDIFDVASVVPSLVQLLKHPSPDVQTVSLKTLANISAGDDSQTQVIVDNGVLPCLVQILTSHHHKNSIRQLTCRVIANITAGDKSQIQLIINSKIIPLLISQLKHAEFNVKKEAAWAILNATSKGTFEQIHLIANKGCILPLCDLLLSPDSEVVAVCLEALDKMLKVAEAEKEFGSEEGALNIYAQEVADCDGLAKIEDLQLHSHPDISHAAVCMLERYWEEEDDGNNDNDDDGKEEEEEEEEEEDDDDDDDDGGDNGEEKRHGEGDGGDTTIDVRNNSDTTTGH